MPPAYTTNCAAVLASNVTSANIIFATPAPYRALSILGRRPTATPSFPAW